MLASRVGCFGCQFSAAVDIGYGHPVCVRSQPAELEVAWLHAHRVVRLSYDDLVTAIVRSTATSTKQIRPTYAAQPI